MLHTLRRLAAGTGPLAAVALLAACGPLVVTPAPATVAAAPLATPRPAHRSVRAAGHVAPTPKPTPAVAPVVKPTPKPVVKPAPAPTPKPAPAPAPVYGTPTVSTGGCGTTTGYLTTPPAFTVGLAGRVVLTHAAGGFTLKPAPGVVGGSWTSFEIYTGTGQDATSANTRAGASGTFTIGGHKYSFSGSWPSCA